MSKVCDICGKGPVAGRSIVRRGMAKKKGGVGRKIVRTNKRRFLPNLVKVKAIVGKATKTIKVCVKCLKSGKVKKAKR
ncbi:MAG: 50S ribosomal protein L28 [Candidatus Omnitrophica bacterium]|nr:50S ribosomal protein L28 [Candidatus Omnitrophota bacterium]